MESEKNVRITKISHNHLSKECYKRYISIFRNHLKQIKYYLDLKMECSHVRQPQTHSRSSRMVREILRDIARISRNIREP